MAFVPWSLLYASMTSTFIVLLDLFQALHVVLFLQFQVIRGGYEVELILSITFQWFPFVNFFFVMVQLLLSFSFSR